MVISCQSMIAIIDHPSSVSMSAPKLYLVLLLAPVEHCSTTAHPLATALTVLPMKTTEYSLVLCAQSNNCSSVCMHLLKLTFTLCGYKTVKHDN